MTVVLSLRRVRHVLMATFALLVAAGFWAEANDLPGVSESEEELIEFLSLSWEQNLPTWVSSLTLFSCAVLLMLNALKAQAGQSGYTAHWWCMAGIFAYISLDEFTTLHENLNQWFDFGGGVLYYSWVVPAGIIVAIIGVMYLGFLRHLPWIARRRFVTAGALYVGGALGVELILGYWTHHNGIHNATYALIDLVEESMEIAGAMFFLYSLLDHLGGYGGSLQLVFADLVPEESPAPATPAALVAPVQRSTADAA